MKKKKRQRTKHTGRRQGSYAGLIIFAVMLLMAVGLYGAAAFYFMSHFLPGTSLSNTDVSLMSVEQAKKELTSAADNYKLTLFEYDHHQETIEGKDFELKAEISDNFDRILTPDSAMLWIVRLFQDKSYVIEDGVMVYNYDEDALSEIIDELDCVDPQYPLKAKDAELVLMDGSFQIVPESVGNVAHRDELEEMIKLCVKNQKASINLENEGLYDEPKIHADDGDMLAKKAACDKIVDMKIQLEFGKKEESIDIQTIANWVSAEKNDKGDYILKTSDEKIKEYVDKLAETYDTYDKTKIFTTHAGNVIEITTGDYGWKLDRDFAVNKLKKIVLSKKSAKVDLTDGSETSNEWWWRVGVGYDEEGKDSYGDTYIEVSIDQQHMWMYQGGSVIFETDVVTGNPNMGNSTPTGAFRIRYHQQNATLTGPGYSTMVAYWMVFADDVGFHDATWQPYFGGQLYLYNGSHGCVNMPLDQAGVLYGLIYDNLPVFVY